MRSDEWINPRVVNIAPNHPNHKTKTGAQGYEPTPTMGTKLPSKMPSTNSTRRVTSPTPFRSAPAGHATLPRSQHPRKGFPSWGPSAPAGPEQQRSPQVVAAVERALHCRPSPTPWHFQTQGRTRSTYHQRMEH
jgi:hypothetical protein